MKQIGFFMLHDFEESRNFCRTRESDLYSISSTHHRLEAGGGLSAG